jgi:hypothetical protein
LFVGLALACAGGPARDVEGGAGLRCTAGRRARDHACPRDRRQRRAAEGNPAVNIKDFENVLTVFEDGVGDDPARLVKAANGTVGLR